MKGKETLVSPKTTASPPLGNRPPLFSYHLSPIKKKIVYLFLAVLGLHGCTQAFSSCCKQVILLWYASLSLRWPLWLWAPALERGLSSCGAQAQLLCGIGIFLGQGSNPHPLIGRWTPQPPNHQGTPHLPPFNILFSSRLLCLLFAVLPPPEMEAP